MSAPSRRDFLAAVAAGAACAGPHARAIDPIRRTGKARLELSLAAYSFRDYLKPKARKPTMTLEDFIDLGAKLELPAVELTAYYFRSTSDNYLDQIKAHCDKHGLKVSGTAVGNDFTLLNPAQHKKQLDSVRAWIEHGARLGAKTMRIFAGKVQKNDTMDLARERCVKAIEEVCDHAAKHKVMLALENHGGITATAEQLLAIVKAVKHDWFGVNLDTGNFHTPNPYADMAQAAPSAVVVQLKTEVFPHNKREQADLKKVTDILRKANYQGSVALEYEAKEDPKTAVPRIIGELKKLMG